MSPLSSLWLVAAAAAQNQCSPVVKVERRNPLDAGHGYAWPDMYAGTWLQPTKRFVRFEPRKIGNIEGAVHAHVYGGVNGLQPTPALTRDFFDFSVEHFSYLTKMAPGRQGQDTFLGNITQRLERYTRRHAFSHQFLPRSIGIVPFGGVPPSKHWQALSSTMLRAVVLSMTDALQRVVVATCDEAHAMRAREALQGLERVLVHNLNLEKCQLPYLPRATQATLKRCLIQRARRERHVYRNEVCQSWLQGEDFEYVMYNDADLVLHARCIRSLGKAMDEDPTLIILPHKLQTFAKDDDPLPELGVAPSIRDLTHDVDSASCCDSGTYPALKHLNQGSFDGCQNFWYNCPKMLALYDFARFDKGTYTPLLLGNEHGRKCLLSETRSNCGAPRRRLAVQRQYLVPLLAFGPNNQFEGLLEALTVAKLVGRTLLLPRYFDPHYRDTHSSKKKFGDVFDEKTLHEFTSVEFVDDDTIKLWKTSPKILASPLNKERLAKALHNVGFEQAPRKKAFVRSHSRAADVAQAFKGFSAAGAVFVALAPLFVVDGEQDLLREAARYRVRSERIQRLASTLRGSLFPGDEKVLCAHVRREAETLGCVPGRRYVVCPTPQGTVPTQTLLDNIVDRAATHGASRIYLAHAGGAGFEDEPSTLLASLEERGFDARTASTDRSVGFESLDPFDVSLVEQELCSIVDGFAPSARSTWSQTVVLDRSARGRRNAKPLDVGPAPVKTRRLPSH